MGGDSTMECVAAQQEPTCRTCPYADSIEEDYFDGPYGLCRAEPPTIVEEQDGDGSTMYRGRFPLIHADKDWCGKHPGRKLSS